MVAVAAALGAWAAVPAASAAPANVKSVPSVLAPSAAPAIAGLPAGMQRVLGTKPITPAASAASSLAFGALWGVACKHPGDCLGIGDHETTTTGTATADLWAGTSWRATGLHLPGGGTGGDMVADNYAPNVLMAVGAYFRGSDSYPVDNIWTGTSWSMGPHQPAVPSGEKYGLLESVSCTSSTFCIASGSYTPASNLNKLIPLVELWNGSSWKLTPPPVPSSSAYADLDGVSCVPNSASPTKSSCVVSGYYDTSTGLQAWADSFDGEHWKNLNIPQPESSSSNIWLNEVSDISCSSPTSCALVGLALELNSAQTAVVSNSGFAETLANGTWTVATVRPSGKNSELIGVDCLSSTFCMASGGVGAYNTPEEGEGAVAVWNGSTWTPTLINPGANIGSELTGVDCTSTTYCAVVGTQGRWDSKNGQATSAFYNGTSWAQHTAP
jgi:hypothetical protein